MQRKVIGNAMSEIPLKVKDWINFSHEVTEHIFNYVLPQYGDKHEDLAANYTQQQCIEQIKKYSARFGKNVRPEQAQLDLLKIAHYAQIAYTIGEAHAEE